MTSIHPVSAATYWTREPQQAPLYSDWKVSFISSASASNSTSNSSAMKYSNKHDNDTGHTRSTASMTAFDDGHTVDNCDTYVDDDGNENISSPSPSLSISPSHASREEEEQQEQYPKKQEVSFAVHRNMIGPRSAYFTKSFLSRTSRDENNNCSSVIHLPSTLSPKAFHSLLDTFEVLLDYCYCYNSISDDFTNTKLTTDNAVAMYCLCNYFEIDKEVGKKIQAFISNDLNQHTVATYYQNVKDLRSSGSSSSGRSSSTTTSTTTTGFLLNVKNPIHEMVAVLCYKHPTVLSDNDFLTKIVDLPLWLSIGSLLAVGKTNDDGSDTKSNKSIEKGSKVWSKYLTTFFETTMMIIIVMIMIIITVSCSGLVIIITNYYYYYNYS